jgi:hypothetical protein
MSVLCTWTRAAEYGCRHGVAGAADAMDEQFDQLDELLVALRESSGQ